MDVYWDDTRLGRVLTKEEFVEFVEFNPGKVFDDLTGGLAGCDCECGTLYVDHNGAIGIANNTDTHVINENGDTIADPYGQALPGAVS
jgi:hypothetical protein